MSEDTPRVICIGEALIELTRGPDGTFTAACAGDSFNTAVYLARAGLGVSFATRSETIPIPTASSHWPWQKGSEPISFCTYRAVCQRCPWSSLAGLANA